MVYFRTVPCFPFIMYGGGVGGRVETLLTVAYNVYNVLTWSLSGEAGISVLFVAVVVFYFDA